jgi:hypothetical protein
MALRRDVRYQVQCPVAFVVDGKPGQGTTFNLSRGGCAIDSDLYAAIDDPIILHITVSSQPTPIAIELGHAAGVGRGVHGRRTSVKAAVGRFSVGRRERKINLLMRSFPPR